MTCLPGQLLDSWTATGQVYCVFKQQYTKGSKHTDTSIVRMIGDLGGGDGVDAHTNTLRLTEAPYV